MSIPNAKDSRQEKFKGSKWHSVSRGFSKLHPQNDFEKLQREFISMASHELRTPLTSILGFSEVLLNQASFDDIDRELQRTFLSYIHNNARVLNAIVDNLLDLNTASSGQKIVLKKELCLVENIIDKALKSIQKESVTNRFEVNLSASESKIWADEQRMRQLLVNLISNAIKFSPPGTLVRITGEWKEEYFELAVSDKGIGIAAEQLEKVVRPFYRIDVSNTAVGGLGLGLSIAKQIVEAHEGQIRIESQLGKGTSVILSFPCRRDLRRGYA
jgi:signal transduction histidine kinase